MSTINVCISSSDEYSKFLSVTLTSLIANFNKNSKMDIYIFDGGISDINKNKIQKLKKKNINIKFIYINPEEFTNCPLLDNHLAITTYYRYKIASKLNKLNKIMYLDCDVIVKKDISDFYQIDIADYFLAGVEDVGYVHHRQYNKDLNIEGPYINAGILLLNLAKWREYNIEELLFDYTQKHIHELPCQDQDVLNAVMQDKILQLPYKYNVQDSFYRTDCEVKTNPNKIQIIKAVKDPTMIHYTGPFKPWNTVNLNGGIYWLKYYLKCPFVNRAEAIKYCRLYINIASIKKYLDKIKVFIKKIKN